MLTKSELEQLLVTTETYCVEQTKSATDKDKFGETVCAATIGGQVKMKSLKTGSG